MTAGLTRNVNSRFKVIQPGNIPFPGKCVVCGNTRVPVLDFGMSEIGYGAILFCELCYAEGSDAFAVEGEEVPLSPSIEDYRKIAEDIKEALNEHVPDLLAVINAGNGLLSSLLSLSVDPTEQDAGGTDGENNEEGPGTDKATSDDAGDKRSSSLSSSRSNGSTAGL